MASLSPLAADLLLFDRYRLKSALGRERTGHTWLANDERLSLEVAVMVFDGHPAPATLERGVDDFKNLSHPNLIRIYDFAGDSERCAVVMEYVEGKSLRTLLRNRSSSFFEVSEIRRWTEQLLSAMNVVHKRGKVHGNLNLENLLINDRNDLKILDLGLREGRLLSRSADRAFTVPSCLSPQVLNEEKVQPTDDLYAIGSCVYELLTGAPLFSGGNLAVQIASKQPVAVSLRREELGVHGEPIPPEWDEWINSCLAKERRDRPQNADRPLEIVRQTAGATSRNLPVPATTAQLKLPVATVSPTGTHMVTTAQGITVPMMYAPLPASSPWPKIIAAAVIVVGAGIFYFASWRPSHEQMKQMDIEFQQLRRADNDASQELDAQREIEGRLRAFVDKYTGVDIPYTDRDDAIRNQAEERYDACVKKIKELEAKLADDKAKDVEDRTKRFKADYDEAEKVSTDSNIPASSKVTTWQKVIESFGNHDTTDEPQNARLLKQSKEMVQKYTAEQKKEAGQLALYTSELQMAVDKGTALKNNVALTPSMRWKALQDVHPLTAKPPGEETSETRALEKLYEQYRTDFEDASRKETPETPLDLQGLFAKSSFASVPDSEKTALVLGSQATLKNQGLLQIDQPDGKPSSATHQAIAEFQRKNGLTANAELTDATLWLLGFEDGPVGQLSALASASASATATGDDPTDPDAKTKSDDKPSKRKIPRRPPESKYDGVMGAVRLTKDRAFKHVDAAEYRKHLAYSEWQDRYGH